jgi:hypothetical protein
MGIPMSKLGFFERLGHEDEIRLPANEGDTIVLYFAGDGYYPSGGWEDIQSIKVLDSDGDEVVEVSTGVHPRLKDWSHKVTLKIEDGTLTIQRVETTEP